MKTNLQFNLDGTISCLWTDAVPLHELGRLQIRRASTIEFKQETQLWEVKLNGKVRYFNKSRQNCLDWEHQHFNP